MMNCSEAYEMFSHDLRKSQFIEAFFEAS